MDDVQIPGALPVYHGTGEAGAHIDGEAPELLSAEQLDRHTDAVTSALRSYGLEVHADSRDPQSLSVEHRDTPHSAELQLDDERGGTWETWSEIPPGSTSAQIAAHVARIIAPTAGDPEPARG